jgi:hypothetical protein
MKDLETMINNWLRPMWEAASGGRMSGDRRYVFTPPFKARVVPAQGVFGKAHIPPRNIAMRRTAATQPAGGFARRRRPPTLVGPKGLSKFLIFNVNSMIPHFFVNDGFFRHFKNLAGKTRIWNIVARNTELRNGPGAALPDSSGWSASGGIWRSSFFQLSAIEF